MGEVTRESKDRAVLRSPFLRVDAVFVPSQVDPDYVCYSKVRLFVQVIKTEGAEALPARLTGTKLCLRSGAFLVIGLLVFTLLTACSGAVEIDGGVQPQGPQTSGAERVTLDVNHCRIERVEVGGRTWVTKRDKVGYGGGLPKTGFTEQGEFVVLGEGRARFNADGGASIIFKPAPAVEEPFYCN